MVLSIKSAAKAAYYYQPTEHADRRRLADGIWLHGSKVHGVLAGSPVEPRALERLLNRMTAQCCETPAFSRKLGQSGYDFVFSAPKSISILWACLGRVNDKNEIDQGNRGLIEDAHHIAVQAAANILAQEAIRERVGKGGRTLRNASAAMAAFLHFRCRPAKHVCGAGETLDVKEFPDPNLHSHVVVPDLVVPKTSAGNGPPGVKIAYTALYRRWAMALGAWYHAAFAHELAKLGLNLVSTGPNGLFSLEGFEHQWTLGFSARTIGAKETNRDCSAAQAFEQSRTWSSSMKAIDVERAWAANAKRLDVRLPTALSKDANKNSAERLGNDHIAGIIKALGESEAIFQRQDIFRAIASYLVENGLHLKPNMKMVDQILGNDRIKRLPDTENYGLSQWTTCQNYARENEVRKLVAKIAGTPFPQLDVEPHFASCATELSDEQKSIVKIIGNAGKLCVLSGGPGTGKTTLLEPLIRAAQQEFGAGAVVGSAEAWLQALQLNARFGVTALSLQSLLFQARRGRAGPITHGTRPSIIIIDEAGLISTERMLEILQLVARFKIKLILLGDTEQLDPIHAGSGMRLVESIAGRSQLQAIQRQDQGPLRDVVCTMSSIAESRRQAASRMEIATHRSKVRTQIGTLCEQLIQHRLWSSYRTSNASVAAIVDKLFDQYLQPGNRGTSMRALVRSHREAQHLTRNIRKKLQEAGILLGEDISLKAVTPMGGTYTLRIARGDHIRFLKRNSALGVYNGTEGRVILIEPGEDPRITVELSPGTAETVDQTSASGPKVVSFLASAMAGDGDDTRVRLSCSYAMTIYGSQGATFDQVLILRSLRMSFRELYVAVSRARSGFEIIESCPSNAALADNATNAETLVRAVTRSMMAAEGSDHRKALAIDLEVLVNTQRPDVQDWDWHALTQDGIDSYLAQKTAA